MWHILKNLRSAPDLSHLTWNQRRIRWNRATGRSFRNWETWFGFGVHMLFIAFGFHFGAALGSSFWGAMVGAALGGFCLGQIVKAVVLTYHRDVLTSDDLDKQQTRDVH